MSNPKNENESAINAEEELIIDAEVDSEVLEEAASEAESPEAAEAAEEAVELASRGVDQRLAPHAAGEEPQAVRPLHEGFTRRDLSLHDVAHVMGWRQPEEQVRVGEPGIEVDQEYPLPLPGTQQSEVGGDHALSGAPLPTRDAHNARRGGGL